MNAFQMGFMEETEKIALAPYPPGGNGNFNMWAMHNDQQRNAMLAYTLSQKKKKDQQS